jgi:hypothetical protein
VRMTGRPSLTGALPAWGKVAVSVERKGERSWR